MNIKDLRRRRQRILAIVVVGLIVAGFAAYLGRQAQLDSRARSNRDDGLAAFERREWTAAIQGLESYLARFGQDGDTAELWLKFALARREIPLPNSGHQLRSLAALQRALGLDPTLIQAKREIALAHRRMAHETEALTFADNVLADHPDDVEMLWVRVDALRDLRREQEAHETLERLISLAPRDVRALSLCLQVKEALGLGQAHINEWALAHSATIGDDAVGTLLQAQAARATGDRARAATIMGQLVQREDLPADADFTIGFVFECDAAGRFDDSVLALRRLKVSTADAAALGWAARRLWFAGDLAGLTERFGSPMVLLRRHHRTNREALALVAMANYYTGTSEAADEIRERLSSEENDPWAQAWTGFLDVVVFAERSSASEIADACRPILDLEPDNPVVLDMLAESELRQGGIHLETALEMWRRLVPAAPIWARPYRRSAEVLLALGRPADALFVAQRARRLAPRDRETLRVWVEALAANRGVLTPEFRSELLANLERLNAEESDDGRTLGALVTFLADEDVESARRRIRAVLERGTTAEERVLLDLAQVSVVNGLAMETEILDAAESIHGVTAASALARGRYEIAAGKGVAAVRSFERRRDASAGGVAWDVGHAQLLESVDQNAATTAWAQVASTHADSVLAQTSVLSSQAAWRDADATDVATQNLRRLTGERAVGWRVFRARWLLDRAGPEDAVAARDLLRLVVQETPRSHAARAMLALALERTGDLKGAESQLQTLASSELEGDSVSLQLARLAQQRGDFAAARRHLSGVVERGGQDADEVLQVARLLVGQGESSRAAALLRARRDEGSATRGETMLLAQLSARAGRRAEAVALGNELLDRADVEAIRFVALLHADAGRAAKAMRVLGGLDAVTGQPVRVAIARADVQGALGDWSAALETLRAAASTAPDNDDVWIAIVLTALRSGDPETVEGTLDSAVAAASGLADLRSERATLSALVDDARLRPLLVAVLTEPSVRESVLEALREIVSSDPGDRLRADLLERLERVARDNPRVLSLQTGVVELLVQGGLSSRALRLAKSAAEQFPAEGVPARQVAQLLAAQENWEDAYAATARWRENGGDPRELCDVLSAQLAYRLGRGDEGLAHLSNRLSAALASPETHFDYVFSYLHGLVLTDRLPEAIEKLEELIDAEPRWRLAWASLDLSRLHEPERVASALDALAPLLAVDDVAGRTLWSESWRRLALQTGEDEYLARSDAILADLERQAGRSAAVLLARALAADSAGDTETAATLYTDVLAMDADTPLALNNLAMIELGRGSVENAVDLARRCVALVPDFPEFQDTLALTLVASGDHDAAADCFARAASIQPTNPRWFVGLAEQRAKAGQVDAARDALGRAAALMDDHGAVADLRDRLRDVRRSLDDE